MNQPRHWPTTWPASWRASESGGRTPSLADRLAWTLNRTRNLSDINLSISVLGMIAPSIFLIQLATFALTFGRPWYSWAVFS